MLQTKDFYSNVVIKIPAPSGNAYVTIVEDIDGNIHKIFFHIGKAGSQVNAWCEGLARMVELSLQHKSINEVINELSQITSSNIIRSTNGVTTRSDIEAFVLALMKYRNSKSTFLKENLTGTIDLNKPAKLVRIR